MWILGSKNRSIYSAVKSGIKNAKALTQFKVAGQSDGLVVFGDNPRRAPSISPLKEIIVQAVSKNPKIAVKFLDSFAENSIGAIYYTDALSKWIKENNSTIPAQRLYRFAVGVLKNAQNIEAVKLGLSICQCINMDRDEQGKDIVRSLAELDELTLFGIYAMQSWTNKNAEIFRLAKNLHGWGRIHAVNYLEPTTDEIRDWLLLEGCKNTVSPVYSAYEVARKIDLLELISAESFDHRQFLPVTYIMLALIKKEPVNGMLELENSHKVIEKYIERATELCDCEKDYHAIYTIGKYLKGQIKLSPQNSYKVMYNRCMSILTSDRCCALIERQDYHAIYTIGKYLKGQIKLSPQNSYKVMYNRCMSILTSDRCCALIERLMLGGEGLDLAEFIGIDVSDAVLKLIETDFYANIAQVERISSEEYMKKVLELGRAVLEISSEPTAYPVNPTDKKYSAVESVLLALKEFTGLGEDFVQYAILSPSYKCRVEAMNTLLEWNTHGYIFTRDILDAIYIASN